MLLYFLFCFSSSFFGVHPKKKMSANVALKEGFRGRKLQHLEVLPSETASVRGSSFIFLFLVYIFICMFAMFMFFLSSRQKNIPASTKEI